MVDMKLRECPLCGNDEIEIDRDIPGSIHFTCGCGIDYISSEIDDAIEAWNTRASDATIEAQQAEIRRLREALERIAEGECNINHPPECCNCAVNIAQAALKK